MTSVLSWGSEKATVSVLARWLPQSCSDRAQRQQYGKDPMPTTPVGVFAPRVEQPRVYSQAPTKSLECGHGWNSGHLLLTCLFSERKKSVLGSWEKEIKSPHGGLQRKHLQKISTLHIQEAANAFSLFSLVDVLPEKRWVSHGLEILVHSKLHCSHTPDLFTRFYNTQLLVVVLLKGLATKVWLPT